MSGPPTAVPGQEIAVTVAAIDPGAADMDGQFRYQVYWGDGTTSEVLTGPASGVRFHETYTTTGAFTPWPWITDNHLAGVKDTFRDFRSNEERSDV